METTLATFIIDMTTATTGLFGTIDQWFQLAMTEPALFVTIIGMPVCNFGVRIVQRLFNLG